MPEKAEDMRSMQEEAIRRVREMQRRSQSYVGQEPAREAEEAEPPVAAGKSTSLFDIAGIKLDEEKALIGLLIYVLYKNNADMKLILALGYLLL